MTDLEIIKKIEEKYLQNKVKLKAIEKKSYEDFKDYRYNELNFSYLFEKQNKKFEHDNLSTGTIVENNSLFYKGKNIFAKIVLENNLKKIPLIIFKEKVVKGIIIKGENDVKLNEFPKEIEDLSSLEILILSKNNISKLPNLSEKIALEYLDLSENNIKELNCAFFENITTASLGSIEVDLSKNKIKVVPPCVIDLTEKDIAVNTNNHEYLDEITLSLLDNNIVLPPPEAFKKVGINYLLYDYYDFINKFSTEQKENRKDNFIKIPISINKIYIDKFNGLKNLTLDFNQNQWIFLTGENGFGKTSILQAIVISLFGKIDDRQELTKNDNEFKEAYSIINYDGFTHINSFDNEYSKFFQKFNSFSAYGPARLIKTNDEYSKTYSLFNSDGKLLDIEGKLKIWYNKNDNHYLYENISNILLQLLSPYIDEIKIEEKTGEYTVKYLENGTWRIFDELAAGYKSIITMFGDMIIRLRKEQPDVSKAEDLAGIVIIDEFDLHLHPKWQRDLVIKLTKTFPKIQFIVSTHSPIPLLGAPKNSVVINVQRDKENGITAEKLNIDFTKLTPNSILTSPIFGLDSLVPFAKSDDEFVNTEKDFKDIEKKEELKREIGEFLTEEKTEELLKLLKSDK